MASVVVLMEPPVITWMGHVSVCPAGLEVAVRRRVMKVSLEATVAIDAGMYGHVVILLNQSKTWVTSTIVR